VALVPARGIVRTLAAAGLGAVLLASVAAPVPAAPNDRGLEELWQEFPLDEEANAPVRGEERVSDESGDVSPPRARPASQPAPREAATPSDGDDAGPFPGAVPVFLTLALLVVLGIAAVARLSVGVPTAPRAGRRPLAVRPLLGSFGGSVERAPRPGSPALAEARAGARVVDDLVRAARAQQPRFETKGVSMARTQHPIGIAPEAATTRAAADEPTTRELREDPKAGLPLKADPDALKLKQTAGRAVDPLKLKAASEEPGSGPGATALKEKLAAPPDDDAVLALKAAATARPARPRLAHGKRTAALRPVPDPAETRREAHAVREWAPARECEIERWRGYVKSQFRAVATDADGVQTTIGISPYFRWRGSDLPETPAAAAALRALVESLQQHGWRVEGRGDQWFAVRLRRTPGDVPAGTAGADR
jgi:hypothetical protein